MEQKFSPMKAKVLRYERFSNYAALALIETPDIGGYVVRFRDFGMTQDCEFNNHKDADKFFTEEKEGLC